MAISISNLLKNRTKKQKTLLIITLVLFILMIFSFMFLLVINKTYTITFKDYDGKTISIQYVKRGKFPEVIAEPQRASDEDYDYIFYSWDKPIEKAMKNETYTAAYSRVIKKKTKEDVTEYTVAFFDDDGKVLKTYQIEEGEMPNYDGDNPTKYVNGVKYVFKSWSPSLHVVSSNQTYFATYSMDSTVNPNDPKITYKDAVTRTVVTIPVLPDVTYTIDSNKQSFIVGGSTKTHKLSLKETLDITTATYSPVVPTGKVFVGYTYDERNCIFLATYEKECTVTFNMHERGKQIQKVVLGYGDFLEKPANPVDEYCSFGGWYKDALYNKPWVFETDKVEGNITLHAKWNANLVSVFFDGNATILGNATVYNIPSSISNVESGNKIYEPYQKPSCDGQIFSGWFKESACINKFNFDSPIVNNITLYAGWNINVATVTYKDINNNVIVKHFEDGKRVYFQPGLHGTYSPAPDSNLGTLHANQSLNLNSDIPSPTADNGWKFKGYSYNEVNSTFTCEYVQEFKVTYNVNAASIGGATISNAPPDEYVEADNILTEPTVPASIGNIFSGWYTGSGASMTKWNFASNKVQADMELTALWNKDCATITYLDSSETTVKAIHLLPNTTISFSAGSFGQYNTPISNITVTSTDNIDITGDSYKPIATTGYTFIGFLYNETTHIFTAQYNSSTPTS